MSGVITRGSNPSLMWPGIIKAWGLAYDLFDAGAQYKQITETRTSTKAYEKMLSMSGVGLVPRKTEQSEVAVDSMKQGYETIINMYSYALSFIVSHEELADDQYPEIIAERPRNLMQNFMVTKEIICANMYNNAFDAAYPGGDGVSLCNTAHPIEVGTLSNTFSSGADLSVYALEQAVINIADFTDNRGVKRAFKPMKLVVAPFNEFIAENILKNPQRPGTADRDINALYQMRSIPQGYVVNNYLDERKNWFLLTNCPNGVTLFQREGLSLKQDDSFTTMATQYRGFERYGVGYGDFKAVYGVEGQ